MDRVARSNTTTGSHLLGSPAGDMVLRVVDGSGDGHLVRTSSAKCTIGSAVDCTVRLDQPGVQPVHCLILHGAAQTIVRHWAEETRLNGRRFTDARLAQGDRLRIGPVQLEFVSNGAADDRAGKAPIGSSDVASIEDELLSAELELARRVQAWAEQFRQIQLERESLRQQQEAWYQATSRHEFGSASATEHSRQEVQETKSNLTELRSERQAWREEQERAESQLAEQAEDLRRQRQQLLTEQDALQQERDAWEVERQCEIGEWKERCDRLKERCDHLKERCQELEQLLQSEAQQTRDLHEFEGATTSDEEQDGATLESDMFPVSDPERSVSDPERSVSDPERSVSDPETSDQGEEAILAETPQDDASANQSVLQPSWLVAREDDEDSDSISDYMMELLRRTSGKSITARKSAWTDEPAPAEPTPTANELTISTVEPSPSTPEPAGSAVESTPNKMDPFTPRSLAPEHVTDITALRALANRSARSAIDWSARKKWGRAALRNAFVSLGLFVCAVLLWMYSAGPLSLTCLVAYGLAILALVLAVQTSILSIHITVTKRRMRAESDAGS